MITTALILAAGRGVRMQGLAGAIPKGFIEIDGTPLIVRSIGMLQRCGIRRVVIVTGHLASRYEALAQTTPGVETVCNDRYAETGSMFSCYAARSAVAESMLLLESDLLYEQRALECLLACAHDDAVLLSGATGSGDEVYVELAAGKIRAISKDAATLTRIDGELVGISKVSLALYRAMIATYEQVMQRAPQADYEACIAATASRYPVYGLKVEDLVWTEIDDERHYRRACDLIAPQLRGGPQLDDL